MAKTVLTTSVGAPVADDNNSISVGPRGPLTFDNHYLFEKLAHFNRERIPERVVHARGTGTFGTFTVTKSMKDFTIADFLQNKGQQTEIFARFSLVGGGQDSSDYVRDPRGFALKFYTNEGNWDMVGNNTPVFFLNDPIKFPDFIHSQKKDARTNLPSPANAYEFWASSPQSLHQITILMSDRGIPLSYRNMHGFSSHTLSFYNAKGERTWVKWHFKTNQGIKTLTNTEATNMPANAAHRDLVDAIERGEFPSWSVKVQIMSEAEALSYKLNPFDLTKVWSHKDFPLIEIGTLELNRNVNNYFAETEQVSFAPSNFVPGIAASPDKMLQARLMAYQDAARYRIGTNVNQIPVNAARCPVNNYQRDGAFASMGCPVGHGVGGSSFVNENTILSASNFYPNDRAAQGAPTPLAGMAPPDIPVLENAWIGNHDQSNEDYYAQAGDLFCLMTEFQKAQLFNNIADGLSQANASIQERMYAQFYQAHPDYAEGVRAAVEGLKQ